MLRKNVELESRSLFVFEEFISFRYSNKLQGTFIGNERAKDELYSKADFSFECKMELRPQ